MAKTDNTEAVETDEYELDLDVLDDTQLAEFETLLKDRYAAIRTSESFSAADDVAELTSIADAIKEVRSVKAARAALDEFDADILFADEDEDEVIVEEDEVVAAPVAQAAVKSDVVISPTGLAGDAPVVAAAERAPLARIAADVRGFRAGQEVDSWNKVASAFISRHPDTRSSDVTSGGRFLVASASAEFPEDRILTDDPIVNSRLIESVTSTDAIVASGGLCAPLTPWYNLQTYGDVCRPLRDSLPVFKADRGGIRYVTPPKLADLAGSSRRTTAAQDAAGYTTQTPAGPTAPKPCLHVVCGTEGTCIVQAVSSCLTFGNLGARTYPEQVEAWLKLSRVEFARYQEQELLAAINTGSTQVTAAQVYGANFSILEQIGFAVDSFKARYRICGAVKLRLVAPFWLKSILANDIAAQGPGDGLGRYSVSEGQINDWLSARGVVVTWTQDTLAADTQLPALSAGAIGTYPASVRWFLFPEGQWLYLDNGTLDLGLVRDSTLNSVNDYQIWMEEFSGVCQVGGIESIAVVSSLKANGSTAPAAAALRA